MNLLFSNKVSQAFADKVISICNSLGINPNWLMFIMNYETAGTFSPSIQNKGGATGLIQFLMSTAQGLGTTTDALSQMTDVEQLDWVYKYLVPYKGDMVDYYTTYLAIFYPAALGQPDTFVFPDNVVRDNPSFFISGNTLADFKISLDNIVGSVVPAQYIPEFKKKTTFCKSIRSKSFSGELSLSY